ncbi:MAG: ABC transporter permease [Acidobacteria bacterium]|nr:ABC transporter permease [Acidobacteriota bacterium]
MFEVTEAALQSSTQSTDTPTQPPELRNRVPAGPHGPVIHIRARGRWAPLDMAEIWRYRELMWFFVWRDVKVRYKQTALGIAWAVLQPVMTMLVFTLVFSRLAHVATGGTPYPLFAYCGLLPWQLFAFSLGEASNSVVSNERLISKVYFPRILAPVAAACSGLMDTAISFLMLLGMFAWYGIRPSPNIIALPAFLLLALVTALAVGIVMAALNVRYRDVRYVLPFLTQFWLLATPVAYPAALIPERWRIVYGLNPMTGVVEGFRWCLLGGNPPGAVVAVSAAIVVALFVVGVYYFRSVERSFADVV